MTRTQWLARRGDGGSLQRTYRQREQIVHVSKRFIPNPLATQAELENKPFDGPAFVGLPGETYNVGRNAHKRARLQSQ